MGTTPQMSQRKGGGKTRHVKREKDERKWQFTPSHCATLWVRMRPKRIALEERGGREGEGGEEQKRKQQNEENEKA